VFKAAPLFRLALTVILEVKPINWASELEVAISIEETLPILGVDEIPLVELEVDGFTLQAARKVISNKVVMDLNIRILKSPQNNYTIKKK
jgi:hypothetical protein